MLESLHIENVAVIKCADIDFSHGFTALTGETGAGKSMIIDSINLLLGGKVSKELIRTGERTALVSALFAGLGERTRSALREAGTDSDEDGNLYIQRTVYSDGKAQTKLNGRTIPLSLQKQIMPLLIDIHGQNDNQALLNPTAHILFLDDFADAGLLLNEYQVLYESRQEIVRRIAELSRNEQEKQRMIELLKYQIADIDSVRPVPGEEEELEAKKKKILNAEKIRKQAGIVSRALYQNDKGTSAYELLGRSVTALRALSDYLPHAEEYADKLEGFRYELEDIGTSASDLLDEDDEDPDALLDKIETRLNDISKLERKYGSDIVEILRYREKSMKELEDIELSDEKIGEMQRRLAENSVLISQAAGRLTALRQKAAEALEKKIMDELAFLEMAKVRFKVAFHWEQDENGKTKYGKRGIDRVEFLIATNAGEPLKPLAKIASGGELSRIMLAIKSVGAEKDQTGTMIFDEIDTGVSGKTAQKIGIKLRNLAHNAQVLCVTHSAQIAAVAHSHFLIRKEETGGRVETGVFPLDREGRVHEIARIMGGEKITDKLLSTADELLSEYNG